MKTRVFLVFSAAIIAASLLFVDPVAQDQAYYNLADQRTLFGIANFWNVISNVPFLFTGAAGLWYFATVDRAVLEHKIQPEIRLAYVVFFLGVFVTCFGSGWFHLAPGNATLIWDRLPMTVAFMGFFTVIIGEHISAPVARRLLWPLLLAGAGSVFYWAWSEAQGAGDLRPYALVQFLPMLLIPIILLAYPSNFGSVRFYWGMLAAYVVSKLLEQVDVEVFESLRVISGHSLKHVAAAIAPLIFLYGIAKRQPRDGGDESNVTQL